MTPSVFDFDTDAAATIDWPEGWRAWLRRQWALLLRSIGRA